MASTASELVKSICEGSATFRSKTTFSQHKYLSRKQKKHVHQVTMLKVTPMRLCEYYINCFAVKTGNLKFEVLSSLLHHANLHWRTCKSVLVYDGCAGLVTGCV